MGAGGGELASGHMNPFDRDTLRLTLVNVGLGVACSVFLVIVARAIIRDLAERAESDATRIADHQPAVGHTMADGGEPVPPNAAAGPPAAGLEARVRREPRRFDPSHLKRTIF